MNDTKIEIYIENKVGYLEGFAILPSDGLVKVELNDYPTDFFNWKWDGSTLTHDPNHVVTPEIAAAAVPALQQQNAMLLKQVTLSSQQITTTTKQLAAANATQQQSQMLIAQLMKEVTTLKNGGNN